MKVYNTIEELKADVVNNNLVIEDDITIKFNLDEPQLNIQAQDIRAWDIIANNINAKDIKAWDINAQNIKARNISALDINARDISYYAVCFVYENCICKSIKGTRENSKHFSLDGEILIKD